MERRQPSGALFIEVRARYVCGPMWHAPLVFRAFAFCALTACVYHVLGVFGVLAHFDIDRTGSTRHAAFVVINIALVWYFLVRPLWVLPLFAALAVQQTYSHGSYAWSLWQSTGQIDAISVVTLAVLYAASVALVRDARARLTAGRSA